MKIRTSTTTASSATAALCLAVLLLCGNARADERVIHPDCKNNPSPELCTDMVNDLITELSNFNQAFITPNAEEAGSFYHPRATLYTSATGHFFIGREDILNSYLKPSFPTFRSANVDISKFHFSVISPTVIVSYGAVPTTITLPSGSILQLPPLPQTLTWIRNENMEHKRPFLITSDQE